MRKNSVLLWSVTSRAQDEFNSLDGTCTNDKYERSMLYSKYFDFLLVDKWSLKSSVFH